jgi:hypothetical protein
MVTFPEPLHPRANPPWLRLLARLFASSLDRQLASGRPPESSRLLAARSLMLVSPSTRATLERNWLHMLAQARRSPGARDPRVPLCRDRIIAAEDAVRVMLDALVVHRPVSGRGVAQASWLLGDGAGPLYNPHCAVDLQTALREVTARVDSAAR